MANNFSATWKPHQAMSNVKRTLSRIQKDMDADKIITWALPKVKDAVIERTTRGLDLADREFIPYSEGYARSHKDGMNSPVTLVESGQMLGQLKADRLGKARAKVFVRTGGSPNRQAIAAAHHRGQGVPRREWLGMSPKDMNGLNRDTVLHLESLLRLTGPGLKTSGKAFRGTAPWRVRNPR